MTLLLLAMFITIGSAIAGNSFPSKAKEEGTGHHVQYKYYKSIAIQNGDTLWEIANEYKTEKYESTEEYVEELKQINALDSDVIHEDRRLLVVYYDSEWK